MTQQGTAHISHTISIPQQQVAATVRLLEGGATIPFIARYRKEATGSLDETQVAAIGHELKRIHELEKRRESILKTIREQGQLTRELELQINSTWSLRELEDLYLPYKPKRRTRGTIARKKGLEPLAKVIMAQREENLEQRAAQFVSDEVPTVDDALAGARDIISEWVNENAAARNRIRQLFHKRARLKASVKPGKKSEGQQYQDYFDYEAPLHKTPGHRVLAIFRAGREEILTVSVFVDVDRARQQLGQLFLRQGSTTAPQITEAIHDSYKRLMAPSIETEFKNLAKERADAEAIQVFARNLRQLLLAPPMGAKPTLAIDPGFRTGCTERRERFTRTLSASVFRSLISSRSTGSSNFSTKPTSTMYQVGSSGSDFSSW
jgi:uncharacterized protein